MDEAEYVPAKLPPKLRGIIWGTLRNSFGIGIDVLRAYRDPAAYERKFWARARQYVSDLNNAAGKDMTVKELAERLTGKYVAFFLVSLPLLAVTALAKAGIEKIFQDSSPESKSKVTFLAKALPNNVTTAMGLSMYRLARLADVRECPSAAVFKAKLAAGSFSGEFLTAWNEFMEKYGFRCPKELDIATPRYCERPELFFRQLKAMAENTAAAHNPQAIFERAGEEREKDFAELLREAERKGKAKKFRRYYDTLVRYEGYREAPKYYWVMTVARLRARVLEAAEMLTAAGRLDAASQVFDLTLDDLDRVMADPSADVRALAAKNTAFRKKLANVREFPRVIDSRGKILQPPGKKAAAGEGTDILVTRATDPGWTPLFINAAGVILEIGGMLQHGALVAREYGKPCVAGIEGAISRLQDGQLVEMDGRNGIIRLLPDE